MFQNKKLFLLTCALLLIIFLVLGISFYFLSTEQKRLSTPKWLAVEIFEYEKKLNSKVMKVERCNFNNEPKFHFTTNTIPRDIVLNTDASLFCSENTETCIEFRRSKNSCLTIYSK